MERNMRSRNILGASIAAAAIAAVLAPHAVMAAEFTVPMDQGRVITFSHSVATVFVGNPLIADVTVIDENRVFITGRNFGSTNIITLDDNGDQLSNDRVNVQTRLGGTVTLFQGTSQTTLACAGGRCQTAPVPSDNDIIYDAVNGQINDRNTALLGAAGGQ
jgi:Flp pilus assembly secretin CpaC